MENNVFDDLIIVKRSGQRVSFNGTKIAIAIKKSFDSVYQYYDEENVNKVYGIVLEYIKANYHDRKTINVEDIQDIIENALKDNGFLEIYYSFNNYRLKRRASRELFDRKQQHKFVRATEKLVLAAQDERNSNPVEQLFSFGKTISEEFSKAYLLDSKFVRNHDEGNIYIQDLDYYVLATTKSSHLDLYNITDYGNYFDKLIEILLNFKKEQYGEHTITSIDYLFIPYVLYEFKNIFKKKLNYFFELEGFIGLLNIKCIEAVIDKLDNIYISFDIFDKFISNNRLLMIFETSYKYSLDELEDILYKNIKKLLLVLNKVDFSINMSNGYSISIGSNNDKLGVFIKNIYFKVLENIDKLDNVTTIYKYNNNKPELNNISKLILSNKNIVISNINATYNKKYLIKNDYKSEIEYFSNGERILENTIDKNQVSIGRILLAETSINLVRIALRSKNIKEFYSDLNDTIELTKNEILQTFEYKSNKYKENFKYIFLNNVLLDSEKLENGGRIRKVIKNGTLNICYTGLLETLYVLLKKDNLIEDDLKLGIDIIKFIKETCDNYSNEYKLNFYVKETYEEHILRQFLSIDKSIFGSIKNVTDKEKYSNFYEVFNYIDSINRFKLESMLHKYSNGGYYEIIRLPKNISNKKLNEIIKHAIENDIGFIKIQFGRKE